MAMVKDLITNVADGLFESEEERRAKENRRKAAGLATDQLDFDKAVYEENRGTVQDLEDDIFGEQDIEAISQRNADKRAALAAKGGYGDVTTPSGKQGSFDFGSGQPAAGVPAAAAPAAGSSDWGWSGTTDVFGNPVLTPPNTSAAPAAAAAPAKNAISDADRALAGRQVQANYGNTLPGQLEESHGRRQTAVDKLIADLNGINRVDAGEYQDEWNTDANRQYLSADARTAQKTAMDKTLAMTDVRETAEEKLMREVARRGMERDLKSQRDAQASQLRTRGAYGSGAELAGFYGSQQELAQRRSLEEMAANANAQKRSLDATKMYGYQAAQLGQQDLQQGGLQDLNDRFNKGQQMDFKKFKTKTQQDENQAESLRAATVADASNGLEDDKRNDINTVTDTRIRVAGAKTGTNLAGAQPIRNSRDALAGNLKAEADADEAQHEANLVSW